VRTIRALLISDIHMSNRLPYAKETRTGVTDRLEDQLRLWEHVGAVVVEKRIDRVLILGDLFDSSRPDPITLKATAAALSSLSRRVPVYVLPGNHDANDPVRGGDFSIEVFASLKLKRLRCMLGQTDVPDLPWIRFWPVEFATISATRDVLKRIRRTLKKERREQEILLLHNSIIGCQHENWKCDAGLTPEEATEGFDATYAGHFHTSQRFGPDGTGLFLGGPLHFRYDDARRRAGFWLVTFRQGEKPRERFVRSRLPRFRETIWPERFEKINRNDYGRITVEATPAAWRGLMPEVYRYRDELRAKGVRAKENFRPVYHHTERLSEALKEKREGGGEIGLLDIAKEYLSSEDVDVTDLDKKQLRRIAKEAIEAAERQG